VNHPPSRRLLIMILLLAALLALPACLPPTPPPRPPRPGQVRVPVVEDLGLEQALAVLDRAGLSARTSFDRETSRRRDHARVYRQEPRPGWWLDPGAPVVLHLYRYTGDYNLMPAPSLINYSRRRALEILEKAGLKADLRWDRKTTNPALDDVVYRQNPAPGITVRRGSRVLVYLYRYRKPPPALVAVPNLQGLVLAQARARAREAGLRLKVVARRSTTLLRLDGLLYAQRPSPGARVPQGTGIKVGIYRYRPPSRLVRVPDLLGKTISQARRSLLGLGLNPRVMVDRPAPRPDQRHRVYHQDPPPDSRVEPATLVTIRAWR